jgi:hypothetical protein
MKAQFELKTWLSENREIVIEKHNELTKEQFYNGITLKDFMLQIMHIMNMNRIKSAKTAEKNLPFLMGQVYFKNSTIDSPDMRQEALKAKYEGTAYMALI